MPVIKVCVAFKAHIGWVNAVAIDIDAASPRPVQAQRLELVSGESREVVEPYHVAGGWLGLKNIGRPDNPEAVIRQGKSKQLLAAKKHLVRYREQLADSELQWVGSVILTTRGRLGDDLESILGSHAHIHIAEGEAIRNAIRQALMALDMHYVEQDEKSILGLASRRLKLSESECDSTLKELKPSGTKSWRKEERLIALGAWLNRNC